MRAPIELFLKQGYCPITLSLTLNSLIEETVAGFTRLLAEPSSYTDQWTFDLGYDDEPDDGFVRKQGNGKDCKAYIHYRPHLPRLLSERNVPIGLYLYFLENLERLYKHMFYESYTFMRQLDHHDPSLHLMQHVDALRQFHVLRILSYDAAASGKIIGKEHTDKSGVTFHLRDSHPGLLLGTDTHPHVTSSEKMLAFAGDRFERLTQGRVPAIPHHVINTKGHAGNRWSVVFFLYC